MATSSIFGDRRPFLFTRFAFAVLLVPLIFNVGCIGGHVIVPRGLVILLIIALMAVLVAIVAGVNKLWGRQINRTLNRMANGWMEGKGKQ